MQTVIVIPCFNEEKRLPGEVLLTFLETAAQIEFLLVNDGCTDATAALIDSLSRRRPDKIKTLHLSVNQGKGAAVRNGLLKALENGPGFVGYWDADLSTPLSEIKRLRDLLQNNRDLDAVIGARVMLIGRRIAREAWRHYTGRFIATLISLILRLPVYDTQCGAKIFRVTPMLNAVLAEPFLTRWLFDVEIIARALLYAYGRNDARLRFYEEPLVEWTHVGASKIGPGDLAPILKELWRIWREYFPRLNRERKAIEPSLPGRQPSGQE